MELCMGCICEATSNCNLTFHCTRGLCGPFLISQIYWKEAGRPTVLGDHPNNKGGENLLSIIRMVWREQQKLEFNSVSEHSKLKAGMRHYRPCCR
jgi:hypothetical protein